jgi:hypothetical protein
MEFTFSASPSPEVVVTRYDGAVFPKFRIIFETPSPEGIFRHLAQPPEEANRSVVIENRSDKDVTALRYRWLMTAEDSKERKQTVSSDSYIVDVYHPVLKSGDRKLLCPSMTVDESFIDHALHGGGGIGGGSGRQSLAGVSSLRLEFDMLLFADGEIAGPDTDKFAAELQCRKPAAEFVAKQVRLAEAEGRDVRPVLSALAEVPYLHPDPLAEWTRRYARECLHRIEHPLPGVDWRSAMLRRLENRPAPPKFYRRGR